MRAVDVIRKKRDGGTLSREEIEAFVTGATSGAWPEYQVAALLMAIVLRGMDEGETAWLTDAMVRSGKRLDLSDLPGPKVDKHSTGGVGDTTSLILAPLAAACGVVVPMMSGRSLAHSGGTLDKIEAIPGFRAHLTLAEFRAALRRVGCALVGQTAEIAPADRVLYALRDVTATVESLPLITGSILSKKIAEGIEGLVLDVKCGSGAFTKDRESARALARSLVDTGRREGMRTEALLTAMDFPLGRAVGNALEVREAVEVLQGRGPGDVEELSVKLTAWMLVLGSLAGSEEEAEVKVREALTSGKGLQKFGEIIAQQEGDPRILDDPDRLPAAPHRELLRAPRAGYVRGWDAERVGLACMALGAGRERISDPVDHAVGAIVHVVPGEKVSAGDALLELHYRDEKRLARARAYLEGACPITDEPEPPGGLILETVDGID
jgi:pyrimidine-nucleoside phosphorylase